MSKTSMDWTQGEAMPAVKVIFQNAFASVQPQIEAALQRRDKDGAEAIARGAYLAAIPDIVQAHLVQLAPALAEAYRQKINGKSHINLIPAPVPVEPPKAMREVTRVTKYTADGRIAEFVREQVEA